MPPCHLTENVWKNVKKAAFQLAYPYSIYEKSVTVKFNQAFSGYTTSGLAIWF